MASAEAPCDRAFEGAPPTERRARASGVRRARSTSRAASSAEIRPTCFMGQFAPLLRANFESSQHAGIA